MNSINLTGRLTADPETRSARETGLGAWVANPNWPG